MSEMADEAEFELWFRRLLPDAIRVAERIVGGRSAAEDVAADAFARALARWSRISRLEYKDAWLLRTVANAGIDVVRRRKNAPDPEPVHIEGDLADAIALRTSLGVALKQLPRRQRQVVVLRHLAEWPPDRIARSLGMSVHTVKTHNDRAIAALRQTVGSTREAFNAQ